MPSCSQRSDPSAQDGRFWSDIGLDWSWFKRRRIPLSTCALVLSITALLAPTYWYGSDVPPVSRTLALLPVTAGERIFFLFASLSAGICEEICYRGLPLRGVAPTRLAALGMLPVTAISFVFVHGWFGWEHLGFYMSVGLAFGGVFILLGRRRLEWLVTAHILVDSVCVGLP